MLAKSGHSVHKKIEIFMMWKKRTKNLQRIESEIKFWNIYEIAHPASHTQWNKIKVLRGSETTVTCESFHSFAHFNDLNAASRKPSNQQTSVWHENCDTQWMAEEMKQNTNLKLLDRSRPLHSSFFALQTHWDGSDCAGRAAMSGRLGWIASLECLSGQVVQNNNSQIFPWK